MSALTEKIEETIKRMSEDYQSQPLHPNFTSLHDLCQFSGKYLFSTKNSLERITAFFLVRHLDNVFLNMGGDTFFNQELQQSKKEMFLQLLESLKKILDNLKKENYEALLKIFSEIVGSYVNLINSLNRQYFI